MSYARLFGNIYPAQYCYKQLINEIFVSFRYIIFTPMNQLWIPIKSFTDDKASRDLIPQM